MQWLGPKSFGPAKQSGPRLLTTVLWGMIRMENKRTW